MVCRKINTLFLLIITTVQLAISQTVDYPVKGFRCPDFKFTQIEHFKDPKTSLNDFKGKWLILYFWTTGCPACVKSFPKLNALQQKFAPDIQFLLIGKNDFKRNSHIREMYEKFRKQYNLILPIAYDTLVFSRFVGVAGVPHVVIIDKAGYVYAVTEGEEINENSINSLIQKKNISFKHKDNEFQASERKRVNLNAPFLLKGNGGLETDFSYRSLLANWKPEQKDFMITTHTVKEQVERGQFQAVGLPLSFLFKLAYFGVVNWGMRDTIDNVSLYDNFSNNPILEVREPSAFDTDFKTGKGFFNYSLIVPREKASEDYVRKIMQSDLRNYLGYEASIEEREVPCWKLVVLETNRAHLSNKQSKDSIYIDNATIRMYNQPPIRLLWTIGVFDGDGRIFFNEIPNDYRINLTIDGDLQNFDYLKEELKKNGFGLIQGHRLMKVLVIRDAS